MMNMTRPMEMWSLAEVIEELENLSTLEAVLDDTGLLDILACDVEDVTVLAPTNDAFGNVDAKFATDPQWILHLVDILFKHVVEGVAESGDLSDGLMLPTAQGENITVAVTTEVCFSPSATGSACTETVDLPAANGIVHVIDDVLVPLWTGTSLRDYIASEADFSTLDALLTCANLTLGDPAITLFAPTNDALMDANATFLCSDEGLPMLTEILAYHVVPSVLPSILIPEGMEMIETAQGQDLTLLLCDTLTVNDIDVLMADILVNNGVIHVIDGLLLPPPEEEMSATEAPSEETKSTKAAKAAKACKAKAEESTESPMPRSTKSPKSTKSPAPTPMVRRNRH